MNPGTSRYKNDKILLTLDFEDGTLLDDLFFLFCEKKNTLPFQKESDSNVTQLIQSPIKRLFSS